MKPADVPPGPLLLDTDVFSWLWARAPQAADFAPLVQGHVLAISFVTVAEARKGALKAKWGDHRRAELERIIRLYVVIPSDDAICSVWAQIASTPGLTLKGDGVNDMWVAACALAQAPPLPVVTGNLADFRRIAGHFPITVVHPLA